MRRGWRRRPPAERKRADDHRRTAEKPRALVDHDDPVSALHQATPPFPSPHPAAHFGLDGKRWHSEKRPLLSRFTRRSKYAASARDPQHHRGSVASIADRSPASTHPKRGRFLRGSCHAGRGHALSTPFTESTVAVCRGESFRSAPPSPSARRARASTRRRTSRARNSPTST